MILDVVLAPTLLEEDELRGRLCAVVDVLRATSTITTALASGADAVFPCLSVEEARRGADRQGRGSALLGGEERGRLIPGFDLGNSPLEYLSAEVVGGKDIFFYTTNGTGAIRRAYEVCGCPIYIAALVNMSAVSSAMLEAASDGQAEGIVILCSGRYGKPAAEDLFCAGLIVFQVFRGLRDTGTVPLLMDGAGIALGLAAANKGRNLDVFASSEHGRYLQSIGFAEDLEFASRLDTYDTVPVFGGDRIILLDGYS